MRNNKLFALWRGSDFLSVNKKIVKLLGLTSSVVLSALVEEIQKQEKNDFFLFTTQAMEDVTTLSRFEQHYALEKLKEKGIVETKLIGFPSQRYIKLNANVLVKFLEGSKNEE